jgi:hypothetical protein
MNGLLEVTYTQCIVYKYRSLGAHPNCYPLGTGALSPGGKSGLGVKLIYHFNLVPKSKNDVAICLHGMVLNYYF